MMPLTETAAAVIRVAAIYHHDFEPLDIETKLLRLALRPSATRLADDQKSIARPRPTVTYGKTEPDLLPIARVETAQQASRKSRSGV